MSYRQTFNIFNELWLSEYLFTREKQIDDCINNEIDNYILNVNETEYINHIVETFKVDILQIKFDEMYMKNEERMISAEQFPSSFHVYSGKSYPRQCIQFYLPFSGDQKLLKCIPNTRMLWTQKMYMDRQEIYFEIIEFGETGEQIRSEAINIVDKIERQLTNLNEEIESFDTSLYQKVTNKLEARKNNIIKTKELLMQINIPIRKNKNTTETFTIPTPQIRKKIISKPIVTEEAYVPHPTLDNKTYSEILKIINDVGKQFERLPSLYKDKGEEHLRDHFLMMLEPNFEGSATGETFNKNGKTDILLRHDSSNVFIAECKFWTGAKGYLSTISQLLSYLTWRDSKAAVIMFVKNKEFSSVIETVKENTPNHENYLGYIDSNDETWFNYNFHINGDKNREVRVAVMLYHLSDK